MLDPTTAAAATTAGSPLADFVLRGLANCWLPREQRWSHCYHLDGRAQPNQSIPESDVFYSLNVLLGFSRVPDRAALPYDTDALLERLSRQLLVLPVKTYALGMALWAAAELRRPLPRTVETHIHAVLEARAGWAKFRAQDLGMLITGLAAQIRSGNDRNRDLLPELAQFLAERYAGPADLFCDAAQGVRRQFASFATQTYLTIACYAVHETTGDRRCLSLANACAARLIALQGQQGEWPWFYHVPTGKVVDFYEVYSVHQDGMAPAFLEHAERHGVPGATQALVRGFMWVYGANQMGVSMLRPDVGMIVRSQVRRGELTRKAPRVLRSAFNALASPSQGLIAPSQLELRQECRSYHLGWVLWSFAARQDLPAITHASALTSRETVRGSVAA